MNPVYFFFMMLVLFFAMIVLFVYLTVRYEWDNGINGGEHGTVRRSEGKKGSRILLLVLSFLRCFWESA